MEREFPYGWWVVLTMFEGGTVEGYCTGGDETEIYVSQIIFRGDQPDESALAIEMEAVVRIDAYRERPPQ